MTDDLQTAREVLARWKAALDAQTNADFLTSYTIGAEELRALVDLATPRPVETGEVIQADRDAAAEINWMTEPAYAFNIKHGHADNGQLVQAFKNHRLAFASPTPAPSSDVLREALALPDDVLKVLAAMTVDWGWSASMLAADIGVPDKRVAAIYRALRVMGWACLHPFFSDEDGLVRGSGYSLTASGETARTALASLDAGSATS